MKYKIRISLLVTLLALSNLAKAENAIPLEGSPKKEIEKQTNYYRAAAITLGSILGAVLYFYGPSMLFWVFGVSGEHAHGPKPCCAYSKHTDNPSILE